MTGIDLIIISLNHRTKVTSGVLAGSVTGYGMPQRPLLLKVSLRRMFDQTNAARELHCTVKRPKRRMHKSILMKFKGERKFGGKYPILMRNRERSKLKEH
jgi:hypothetical protein